MDQLILLSKNKDPNHWGNNANNHEDNHKPEHVTKI